MQEVDELRLGRERQARKRKAATEKKQAEAKAAEEAAKVKELEEKALRAREEKQRDELLAQNKALSERLLAMCPTSKPVQPVYAPQTVSSPHTSLSLPVEQTQIKLTVNGNKKAGTKMTKCG